jgi:uncharacterized protein
VAFLKADDVHHDWAVDVFARLRPPLLTCESVLTEAVYLLRRLAKGPTGVLELVRRGTVKVLFKLTDEADAVSALIRRYGPARMDLADACLVRMTELHTNSSVLTVDSAFRDVYRRHGRKTIPTLLPAGTRRRVRT